MDIEKLKKTSDKHAVSNKGPWTRFMDMHSGGSTKVKPFEYIYIQAEGQIAKRIFYGLFGRNPHRVTCTCCGEDYSISENETDLKQATAYERGCLYDKDKDEYLEKDSGKSYCEYVKLSEYVKKPDVLVIYWDMVDIEKIPDETHQEGYVWAGG